MTKDESLFIAADNIKALQSEIKALKDRVESLEAANQAWAE